jgi:hypothetical protein
MSIVQTSRSSKSGYFSPKAKDHPLVGVDLALSGWTQKMG